jgi:hypothetical protein
VTIGRLIRELTALAAKHGNRVDVCVDKGSLWDGNGTFEICRLKSAAFKIVEIADGDGFMQYNKDGSERTERNIILSGETLR